MKPVSQQEIIYALREADTYTVVPTYRALARRIEQFGIEPPKGYVLVPIEPTLKQIEHGAMAIASWDADCIWPESWSMPEVIRMRKDARSAYIAMLNTTPRYTIKAGVK